MAKLHYVKLDTGFFGKAKQKTILIDHGPAALLYLLRIYALLAETTCGKITTSAAIGCALDVGVSIPDARKLLAIFTTEDVRNAEAGTLLEMEGDVVFLSRIIDDQKAVGRKRDADVERQRQKRDIEATSKRVESDSAATPYSSSYSSNCSSSSNSEGGAGETIILPDATPPDVVEAVSRWAKHCETLKPKPKAFGQMQAEGLINLYQGKISELPRDINHSISSGYRTVYAAPQSGAAPPKFIDFEEERRRKTKEILRKFAESGE